MLYRFLLSRLKNNVKNLKNWLFINGSRGIGGDG